MKNLIENKIVKQERYFSYQQLTFTRNKDTVFTLINTIPKVKHLGKVTEHIGIQTGVQ